MMRKALLWLLFAPLLLSCEYEANYGFYVENQLSDSLAAEIQVVILNDSIQVPAGAEKLVYSHGGGIISKKDHPDDIRYIDKPYWHLPEVKLYLRDSLVNYNFANQQHWTYTSKPQVGSYRLKITNDFLDSL